MVVRKRASSVIVHSVEPADRERFLAWQDEIAKAASAMAGYQGTDVYPPDPGEDQWVIVIHYDDEAALREWIGSPVRAEHIARYPAGAAGNEFQIRNLPKGFGHYFTRSAPPAWKMMFAVLCALFPTVVLLSRFLGPYTSTFGFTVSILIGNAASVCLLEWVVMPPVTRALGPWLRAKTRKATIAGLAGVIVALTASTLVFRHLFG